MVCLLLSDELWVYDQIIYEYYLSLLRMHDLYSFVFLSDLLIWFAQLD